MTCRVLKEVINLLDLYGSPAITFTTPQGKQGVHPSHVHRSAALVFEVLLCCWLCRVQQHGQYTYVGMGDQAGVEPVAH
jgi:hypothetical protein